MATVYEADTDGADEALAAPASTLLASAEEAAELLRSIGSAHRLVILCLLADGPRTVTDICAAANLRQSLASQHLSRLRLDGLVKAERQGHFVHYSLAKPIAREIIAILYRHFCAPKPDERA